MSEHEDANFTPCIADLSLFRKGSDTKHVKIDIRKAKTGYLHLISTYVRSLITADKPHLRPRVTR